MRSSEHEGDLLESQPPKSAGPFGVDLPTLSAICEVRTRWCSPGL
jgi:hypothetical protein